MVVAAAPPRKKSLVGWRRWGVSIRFVKCECQVCSPPVDEKGEHFDKGGRNPDVGEAQVAKEVAATMTQCVSYPPRQPGRTESGVAHSGPRVRITNTAPTRRTIAGVSRIPTATRIASAPSADVRFGNTNGLTLGIGIGDDDPGHDGSHESKDENERVQDQPGDVEALHSD